MAVDADVQLDDDVVIHHPELVNLYGCKIGAETRIGAFVEVQKGSIIGKRCKVSSHSFICEGVTIEDEVFIGHGVVFANDKYPRAVNEDGERKGESDWKVVGTVVQRGASIGSHATFCRRYDRNASARGGGRRRNAGCSGRCDCGRGAGESSRQRRPERRLRDVPDARLSQLAAPEFPTLGRHPGCRGSPETWRLWSHRCRWLHPSE